MSQSKIKAIIVDDEAGARNILTSIIDEYIDFVEVVDTAASALEGIGLIQRVNPDLIFLDIEMPHGSGFDLLDGLNAEQAPYIVFVTAYDQYAIRAIKYSAFDYLLKPIGIDSLENACLRVKEKIDQKIKEEIFVLKQNINSDSPSKVVLRTLEETFYIDLNYVLRVEADGAYSRIFSTNLDTKMISKSLGEIEDLFMSEFFFRPHRTHLINLKMVKSFSKLNGGTIILTDDTEVDLSRRKKELFTEAMKKITN